MVVLIEDDVLMTIASCSEKVVGPKNNRHEVVCSNEFGFSRAAGLELLLGGSADGHSFSKQHATTCVATHVRMSSVQSFNPPIANGNRMGS